MSAAKDALAGAASERMAEVMAQRTEARRAIEAALQGLRDLGYSGKFCRDVVMSVEHAVCRASDEVVELLQSKDRRARKDHRCDECLRTIGRGETYRYEAWLWEGDMGSGKTCLQCVQVRQWLEVACDGWNYSELEDDLFDHVTGEESIMRTRPLTRLARWMRDDWRDRGGHLRSVDDVRAVVSEAVNAYWRHVGISA